MSSFSSSSVGFTQRGHCAPSGAVALNNLGESLHDLKGIMTTRNDHMAALLDSRKPPKTHELLASKASSLVCEHEGIFSDKEMVAVLELFGKASVHATTYLNIPKKEWQWVWVENRLVELGLHGH